MNGLDRGRTPATPERPASSTYLELDPPYHTPNLPVTSASELLALPGFGRARFERIAPYVTALPVNTPLNTCTAPAQVLDAYLGQTQFSADPKQFAQDRAAANGGCFPPPSELKAAIQNTLRNTPPNSNTSAAVPHSNAQPQFAQTSQIFRLTSVVRADGDTAMPGATSSRLLSARYWPSPR